MPGNNNLEIYILNPNLSHLKAQSDCRQIHRRVVKASIRRIDTHISPESESVFHLRSLRALNSTISQLKSIVDIMDESDVNSIAITDASDQMIWMLSVRLIHSDS